MFFVVAYFTLSNLTLEKNNKIHCVCTSSGEEKGRKKTQFLKWLGLFPFLLRLLACNLHLVSSDLMLHILRNHCYPIDLNLNFKSPW